jgi:hypothetical protein
MIMTARISLVAGLVATMLAFGGSSAYASLSDEVNAGKAVAVSVDAGTASCKNLSTTDFEHLGEYLMDRMVGSRSAHQAMNTRMDAMIGAENTDRMHEALGRRYAGCAPTGSGVGYGMMGGGYGGTRGWGAMMGSGYAWMRNGVWQHMTRGDWQRAGGYMMGNGWMIGTASSGWSSGAVIGVVLGALLVGGLAASVLLRRARRQPPSTPTPAQ